MSSIQTFTIDVTENKTNREVVAQVSIYKHTYSLFLIGFYRFFKIYKTVGFFCQEGKATTKHKMNQNKKQKTRKQNPQPKKKNTQKNPKTNEQTKNQEAYYRGLYFL